MVPTMEHKHICGSIWDKWARFRKRPETVVSIGEAMRQGVIPEVQGTKSLKKTWYPRRKEKPQSMCTEAMAHTFK